jgi:hypothetical protein
LAHKRDLINRCGSQRDVGGRAPGKTKVLKCGVQDVNCPAALRVIWPVPKAVGVCRRDVMKGRGSWNLEL